MAEHDKEPVLVIGLGRFGSAIALELTRRGTDVLALDNSAKLVQSLSGQLTQVVTADCTDAETLRQLGVDAFNRAVVAIGTDLEASILATSLLVEFGVPDIWAKAVSQHHGRILERMGASHVVYPEGDMGERVAHLLSGRMLDYMQIDGHTALVKMKPPRLIVGVPLAESRLRSRTGVTIVGTKREGEDFTYATQNTIVTYDDIVLVMGRIEDVDRMVEED